MGLGEYDRNMISEPIAVQKAIQGQLEYSDAVVPQAVLRPSTMLRKGHQRVVVIPGAASSEAEGAGSGSGSGFGDSGLSNYQCSAAAFEVVLHQGEAYLQVVADLVFPPLVAASDSAPAVAELSQLQKQPKLLDYSSGWKHTVCLYRSG